MRSALQVRFQAHPGVILVSGRKEVQFNEVPLHFPKSRPGYKKVIESSLNWQVLLESFGRLLFLELTCVGESPDAHCATESCLEESRLWKSWRDFEPLRTSESSTLSQRCLIQCHHSLDLVFLLMFSFDNAMTLNFAPSKALVCAGICLNDPADHTTLSPMRHLPHLALLHMQLLAKCLVLSCHLVTFDQVLSSYKTKCLVQEVFDFRLQAAVTYFGVGSQLVGSRASFWLPGWELARTIGWWRELHTDVCDTVALLNLLQSR